MTKRSILVIDDQEGVRASLQATLADAGYLVRTAANGHEAAKVSLRERFDLVLTDILMPGKDGIEVLKDLRRNSPNLPVIAMSGGGRIPAESYLKIARVLGAKAILQKPFSKEQLLITIAFALPEPPS